MKHTPGPWEAKNIPSAGWQIRARLKSYEDQLLRFFETSHTPNLRVEFSRDSLNLIATLGYETWCQFPVDGWERELAANMRLIAAAPDLLEALVKAAIPLEAINASVRWELVKELKDLVADAVSAIRKAIAKAGG